MRTNNVDLFEVIKTVLLHPPSEGDQIKSQTKIALKIIFVVNTVLEQIPFIQDLWLKIIVFQTTHSNKPSQESADYSYLTKNQREAVNRAIANSQLP